MTGALFVALGVAAALLAAGYQEASAAFPMALGTVLAGLGALLLARALVRAPTTPRSLADRPLPLAIAVAATAAYIAAVPALGFFTASVLLLVALPVALGLRRPVLVALATALFATLVWFVFTVILEKPLPREIWAA